MDLPLWAKVGVAAVGTVAAAYFTAQQATTDKVSDTTFDEVTVKNCQSINDLKKILQDILSSAPLDPDDPEVTEDYLAAAVRKLETTDCSTLHN